MRRTTTTLTTLAAAAGLLVGPAPGFAEGRDHVEWKVDASLTGDTQELAVHSPTGDVLALTMSGVVADVARRLDGRTGRVEWEVERADASHLAVHQATGRVVLAGAGPRGRGQVLGFVSADGEVTHEVVTPATTYLVDVDVDQRSGQVCTLGAESRHRGHAWVTSCWSSDGTPVFSREWRPAEGPSLPSDLAIDPASHRVYVTGTSRPAGTYTGPRQDVVLLAHTAGGEPLWERRTADVVFSSSFEMTLDPERRRVHLLGQPDRINSPMRLISYGADGRRRFSRAWMDRDASVDSTLAVTASGRLLAVSAGYDYATLRSHALSGRLLGTRVVRISDRGSAGYIQEAAIDPRRRVVHVLTGGGGPRHPAKVGSYSFDGRRLSRAVVDRRDDVLVGDISLHVETGRVFASTTRFPLDGHRVAALRP